MGIRREEEMEMSDDDMEDAPDTKDSEDSGKYMISQFKTSIRMTGHALIKLSRVLNNGGRQLHLTEMTLIPQTP